MKKNIFILALILICSFANAQKSNPDTLLKQRNQIVELQDSVARLLEKNQQLSNDVWISQQQIKTALYEASNMYQRQDNFLNRLGTIVAAFAVGLTILGIIGSLVTFFGIKNRLVNQIKTLEVKNKNQINDKIAEFTDKNKASIEGQIKSYETKNDLKMKSNIIILNKAGSGYSNEFKKVMKAFKVDLDLNPTKLLDFVIEIDDLTELFDPSSNLIEKVKQFDILLIENQHGEANQLWELGKQKLTEDQIDFIKNNTREQLLLDSTSNAEKHVLNNKVLIDLCEAVCSKTAVFYYGNGTFPSFLVDKKHQHKIAYANAPSQLYGNLLNMHQYLHVLGKL